MSWPIATCRLKQSRRYIVPSLSLKVPCVSRRRRCSALVLSYTSAEEIPYVSRALLEVKTPVVLLNDATAPFTIRISGSCAVTTKHPLFWNTSRAACCNIGQREKPPTKNTRWRLRSSLDCLMPRRQSVILLIVGVKKEFTRVAGRSMLNFFPLAWSLLPREAL